MKGKHMTVVHMKSEASLEAGKQQSWLRRLWQSVLRFDEALNFDPQDDLARRIAELEKKLGG
jgi:hypothetical protein